jgi:hypothetical protein
VADGFSYWKVANQKIPWEGSRAFQRLASEASAIGREQGLSPERFDDNIYKLYEAYDSLLAAMNDHEVEPQDRVHWHNHYRDARLDKKLGQPPISDDLLSGAAYEYLNGPMRVSMFDRALIDALIAQETFAYIDRHAGRGVLLTQLGCWGTWLVLFLIFELFFGIADFNWTRLWLAVGGLLVFWLVIWAWPRRGPYALYRAMKDTYQALTGSVVSVADLRRRVERSRDKGVVWPPELYAILDDVESRTKVL